jgi:hypothetical protein
MYELLEEVASGKNSFAVRVEGYGLTKAGGANGGAQGGVGGLNKSSGGGGSSLSGGASNSTSVSGGVDFGGWTTI